MQFCIAIAFLSQLKFYGGREQVLSVMENVEFIGFTLPATSVTSSIIPISSDVVFVNLYPLHSLCR
jgi:hypothetical protein